MPLYTDQLQREVAITHVPQRIISLVPSQTELLYDIGLECEVVGITKFCVHPANWNKIKTVVGGTKNLNINKIKALAPDLIIANKEENSKEQIDALANDFPVWISDVYDLRSALAMIDQIGKITSRVAASQQICKKIEASFDELGQDSFTPFRSIYLIWRYPYMSVGGDTFIHKMLEYAGFENVLKKERRYPLIEISKLRALDCELILLSSEPYPFKQKNITEIKTLLNMSIGTPINIKLVDGEMFSWYGSRLLQAPSYFRQLRLLL